MKKTLRSFLSLLLVFTFALQLGGVSARAEDGALTGEEPLVFALYTLGEDEELVRIEGGSEGHLLDGQSCEVRFGEASIPRAGGTFQLKQLNREDALTAAPPKGYFVSRLYLYGEALDGQEPVDLLALSKADPRSAAVALPGELFFTEDGDWDPALFSSLAAEDGGYTLYILIEKLPDGAPVTVSYTVDGQPAFGLTDTELAGEAIPAAALDERYLQDIRDVGMRFTGWQLTYSNKSSVLVAAGEELLPYESVTLEAQWEDLPQFTLSVTGGELVYGEGLEALVSAEAHYAGGLELDFSEAQFLFGADGEEPAEPVSGPLPVGEYTLSLVSGVRVLKDGAALPEEDVLIEYGGSGSVSVTQRPIRILANAPVLDGEDVWADGYELSGALAPGDTLVSVQISEPELTDGLYTCSPSDAVIVNADGEDATGNYAISYLPGQTAAPAKPEPSPEPAPEPTPEPTPEPEEEPIPLTVTADSGTWVYDGTAHTIESYTLTGSLEDGDTIASLSFESGSNSITDAGQQEIRIASVTIVDSQGQSVNEKYRIELVPGTLTVTKAPLTLTAESASKPYDGKALENKNVAATRLANSSHKLSVRFEVVDANGKVTKAIEVGTYTKRITKVEIKDGDKDVSANYNIRLINGTLTVDPAADGKTTGSNSNDSSQSSSGSSAVPLTGDESNLGLWTALLAVSAMVLLAAIAYGIYKKKNSGEK